MLSSSIAGGDRKVREIHFLHRPRTVDEEVRCIATMNQEGFGGVPTYLHSLYSMRDAVQMKVKLTLGDAVLEGDDLCIASAIQLLAGEKSSPSSKREG